MRVLLAEDDVRLGGALNEALTSRGCSIDWCKDGRLALDRALSSHFDIVILDLNLPGCAGSDVLTAIRSQSKATPVLVLTARGEVSERVRMLNQGADDYLIKPFDLDELYARLCALYRRTGGGSNILTARALAMDVDSHAVTYEGNSVSLPPKEFALLRILLEHAGRVCDRDQLERALYGWNDEVLSNAVEVHIHHLRKKFGIEMIRTIRGVGYMIEQSS